MFGSHHALYRLRSEAPPHELAALLCEERLELHIQPRQQPLWRQHSEFELSMRTNDY